MPKALYVPILAPIGYSRPKINIISSKFDHVLLVCDEGDIEIDPANPPENTVEIGVPATAIGDYVHVKPYGVRHGKDAWFSNGGCLISESDARFSRVSHGKEIHLHDRKEW